MKRYIKYCLFSLVCILLYGGSSFAQDVLLLNDGKIYSGSLVNITDESVVFSVSKNGKLKIKLFDRYDVFSIRFEDGTKKMIYEQDFDIGYDLTTTQMSKFVLGHQLGKKLYRAPFAFFGGVASGLVSPLYTFSGVPVPMPIGYILLVGVKQPKIKKRNEIDKRFLNDEFVMEGYREFARKRKLNNSVAGGIIGFTASLIFFIATSQ